MKKLTNQLLNQRTPQPIKVLQFGEGNFMRAFVDWQIQQMNKQGFFNGNVAVVQPIRQGLSKMLNEQDNLYTVLLEGILNGEVVESSEIITVIDETVDPYENWERYLELAAIPELEVIVSNTTEAGIQYHEEGRLTDRPPQSFPAKLTVFLYKRFQSGQKGLTIIPCELIDRNGEKLKEIIETYASDWQLGKKFQTWLLNENIFCCSLVDRIVPGYPRETAKELQEKLGYEDNLMVKAEPFMLWVIEGPESVKGTFPLAQAGLNVIVTDDMTPYRERKVHLLNGPHTAMVPLGLLANIETVEDIMKDLDFRPFIDCLMEDELIPTLELPQNELKIYADQIKERFLNPFVHHELSSIALNSVSKFKTRLLPAFVKFIDNKKMLPPYITASLSGLILSYRGDKITPQDEAEILTIFADAWKNPDSAVEKILSNQQLWEQDLTSIEGLVDKVVEMIETIETKGSRTLIQKINQGV